MPDLKKLKESFDELRKMIGEQDVESARIYINSKADMKKGAEYLGVRDDWHEPDEQEVDAYVDGKRFDNAGVAGEIVVTLFKDEKPIAEVNLATLFAIASGTV